jgi:hypothetical protein
VRVSQRGHELVRGRARQGAGGGCLEESIASSECLSPSPSLAPLAPSLHGEEARGADKRHSSVMCIMCTRTTIPAPGDPAGSTHIGIQRDKCNVKYCTSLPPPLPLSALADVNPLRAGTASEPLYQHLVTASFTSCPHGQSLRHHRPSPGGERPGEERGRVNLI